MDATQSDRAYRPPPEAETWADLELLVIVLYLELCLDRPRHAHLWNDQGNGGALAKHYSLDRSSVPVYVVDPPCVPWNDLENAVVNLDQLVPDHLVDGVWVFAPRPALIFPDGGDL